MKNVLRIPRLRLAMRRAYQVSSWFLSRTPRCSDGIIRMTPLDGEHLCGYYDKSPWDATGKRFLTLRIPRGDRHPRPGETAEIRLVSADDPARFQPLAACNTWNLQQGCMLQWLGPDFSRRIIYNDFRDGGYCSVIREVSSGRESLLSRPVYAVSRDGAQALSLDFARLHRMRPGYGYSILPDSTSDVLCPDSPCIWHIDINKGAVRPIMRYTDLLRFESRPEMVNAEHKVNHLMIAPSGNRFMLLHRWRIVGARRANHTRLVTADMEGSGMWNLLDSGMVSHCCFRDDGRILAWARGPEVGNGYVMLMDQTNCADYMWDGRLRTDGHPSYSPDGRYVVTDTYPDRCRRARVIVIDTESEEMRVAACVLAHFRYDGEVRCDLHPRWSHDGTGICFDASFEGARQSYAVVNPFLGDSASNSDQMQMGR